jgi:rfaE bifunctional protein kinase chain/domain/rfaE bifunctional protein nucleotidyltransferase chain/domain
MATMPGKILNYEQVVATAGSLRSQKKTIVHCHGVYDLLHVGHIKHLEAARRLGHVLIVTITPDRFVNKGSHRPAFTETLRAAALAALACVDYVAINSYPTAVELIGDLRPDVYVKGAVAGNGKRDHTDAITREEQAIKAVGGRLVLTNEATFSSSTLINRFLDVFTPEERSFLASFRARYTAEQIVGHLQAMRDLKVLAIGEAIVDEYVFCDSMGRASKEAVLVVGENRTETYAGGILAIANHVAAFCEDVAVASALGETDSYEAFVGNALKTNVARAFVTIPGVPTMVKRRYVEEYLGRKLFEVYNTKALRLRGPQERAFLERLDALVPQYEVVIVADYGHGLLTDQVIARICEKARFLAVNTQTNAGNLGFHVVSKYPHADFIAVAEPEVRLQHRDSDGDLHKLITETARALRAPKMIVTRGKRGCICYDERDGFVNVPAVAVSVVDRIGAGDALLALSAPAAAMGLPMELAGFIGNVAGAEACAVMGNGSSIEATSFFRHVTSLLM